MYSKKKKLIKNPFIIKKVIKYENNHYINSDIYFVFIFIVIVLCNSADNKILGGKRFESQGWLQKKIQNV